MPPLPPSDNRPRPYIDLLLKQSRQEIIFENTGIHRFQSFSSFDKPMDLRDVKLPWLSHELRNYPSSL